MNSSLHPETAGCRITKPSLCCFCHVCTAAEHFRRLFSEPRKTFLTYFADDRLFLPFDVRARRCSVQFCCAVPIAETSSDELMLIWDRRRRRRRCHYCAHRFLASSLSLSSSSSLFDLSRRRRNSRSPFGRDDDDAERGETDNCLLQRERKRDVLALGRSLTRVHPSIAPSFETRARSSMI